MGVDVDVLFSLSANAYGFQSGQSSRSNSIIIFWRRESQYCTYVISDFFYKVRVCATRRAIKIKSCKITSLKINNSDTDRHFARRIKAVSFTRRWKGSSSCCALPSLASPHRHHHSVIINKTISNIFKSSKMISVEKKGNRKLLKYFALWGGYIFCSNKSVCKRRANVISLHWIYMIQSAQHHDFHIRVCLPKSMNIHETKSPWNWVWYHFSLKYGQ